MTGCQEAGGREAGYKRQGEDSTVSGGRVKIAGCQEAVGREAGEREVGCKRRGEDGRVSGGSGKGDRVQEAGGR